MEIIPIVLVAGPWAIRTDVPVTARLILLCPHVIVSVIHHNQAWNSDRTRQLPIYCTRGPGPYYCDICEPVILEPTLERSIGLKRVKTKDRDASKLAD